MHVVAGLRQALVMLAGSAVLAAAAATVWLAVSGGAYRPKLGLALMITGAVISVTGGTVLSRLATNDARAYLGAGPDREEPSTGGGALTPIGVFLFVSLPMLVVGGVVYGRG